MIFVRKARDMNIAQAAALQKRARPATWDDAIRVCALLNDVGCNYCLHGGFAIAHWLNGEPDSKRSANIERADSGEARVSAGADSSYKGDVDIAIPRTIAEFEKLRGALGNLPGKKILKIPAHILAGKLVIRLIEDFSIDIITNIGGIEFEFLEILPAELQSPNSDLRLTVPLVSADCLVRIKQFVIRRDVKHVRDLDRLTKAGFNGNFTKRIISQESRNPGNRKTS
jgi:hypothetical protein